MPASWSDTPAGVRRLELVNAHLEPLSSPRTLWIFKNPRGRQVRAILDLLDTPRFTSDTLAGVVLGGDFNTVIGGDDEEGVSARARRGRGACVVKIGAAPT